MWATRQVVCLAMFLDDVIEHLKEDVRRAQHPQRTPKLLPVEPPGLPTVQPLPNGPRPRRIDAPAPIPDSLPARALS